MLTLGELFEYTVKIQRKKQFNLTDTSEKEYAMNYTFTGLTSVTMFTDNTTNDIKKLQYTIDEENIILC